MGGWTARSLAPDPEEERQLARKRNGVNTDALYGGFYELAKLTPEQQERFRQLRLDRSEQVDRLYRTASSQNGGQDRELAATTLDVIKEDVSSAFDQRIAEEFGSETLELLKRYDSERSLRSLSGQLATVVVNSSEPLSPAQSERLISTLSASAITSNGTLDFSTIDVAQTLRAVGAFLSPGQTAALKPILESKVRAANERVRPLNLPN